METGCMFAGKRRVKRKRVCIHLETDRPVVMGVKGFKQEMCVHA